MSEKLSSSIILPAGESYDIRGVKLTLALLEKNPGLLPPLRNRILARARDIFESGELDKIIKRGDRILYVGTGSGYVPQFIESETTSEVIKLDVADIRFPGAKDDRFVLGNARFAPFLDNSFDVVTLIDMLHHCRKPEEIVSEAQRVLKPQGKLILLEDTLPEKDNRMQRRILFSIISLVDDMLNQQPAGVNPHNYKSIEEWNDLFTKLGFSQTIDTKFWYWGLFDFIPFLRIPRTNHPNPGRFFQSARFVFTKSP